MTDEHIFGKAALESSVLWFAAELFRHPKLAAREGVEIDYRPAQCPQAAGWGGCRPRCLKGALVKIEGRVWKLTGRYDHEHQGYEGHWPD